jgi:hypothetical protein
MLDTRHYLPRCTYLCGIEYEEFSAKVAMGAKGYVTGSYNYYLQIFFGFSQTSKMIINCKNYTYF